eukprot:8544800-Pyramimonas_sp.AAC.1
MAKIGRNRRNGGNGGNGETMSPSIGIQTAEEVAGVLLRGYSPEQDTCHFFRCLDLPILGDLNNGSSGRCLAQGKFLQRGLPIVEFVMGRQRLLCVFRSEIFVKNFVLHEIFQNGNGRFREDAADPLQTLRWGDHAGDRDPDPLRGA